MLEKDGEHQLDRSCEKRRSVTQSQGGEEILHTIKTRKANWVGHVLRRKCFLEQVTEGNIEGWIKVTERRRRRKRKQLLDDVM